MTNIVALLVEGKSIRHVAWQLGIDRCKISRRLGKLGLKDLTAAPEVVIPDSTLDRILWCLRFTLLLGQNNGVSMIEGQFRNLYKLAVPRRHICASLKRIEPGRVEFRRRKAIKRRVYRVPGPMSLWHNDGNHKWNRWRIVVHGCIDGYSRYVVYCGAAATNDSETVLAFFLNVSWSNVD